MACGPMSSILWTCCANCTHLISLGCLCPTGTEIRDAGIALSDVRNMGLEGRSWDPRWAVGELSSSGRLVAVGLGCPAHGTSV
jgi:hypothetical protein